ncbi:MAG: acylphosphatase [Chitinophagaceae bacterium]|nr:MAG: acylphosphatase [Chitinophagaceae bacterium]
MKNLIIRITGKVQGVGFRETTKYVADQMGVKGIVRNEKDGSVYMEIEADEILLEEMLNWSHEGPDRAQVEEVIVSDGEVKGYKNFEVVKR